MLPLIGLINAESAEPPTQLSPSVVNSAVNSAGLLHSARLAAYGRVSLGVCRKILPTSLRHRFLTWIQYAKLGKRLSTTNPAKDA